MKSKSTYLVVFYCSITVCSWLIITHAHPVENQNTISDSFGFLSNELPQEELNSEEQDSLIRNKRTIGFLRQLFPGLSQIIDRKIQQITRVIFRVVGRLILRGGAGGGGGAAGGSDSGSGGDGKGRRISITLPTYPPFEDEEEEEGASTDSPTSEKDAASSDTSTVKISVSSSSASPSTDSSSDGVNSTVVPADATETTDSNTIRRINRDVSDVLGDTTLAALSEETSSTTEASKKSNGLLSRLREMRSKRGSGGLFGRLGNGGGSGNFFFDIIRLIAGSGTSPEKDEEQNAPRDERDGDNFDSNDASGNSSYNSEDNYTAGIPGPLTRLFILANRGISNLIQDLILRLAQTSERIVNYKARLVTSII